MDATKRKALEASGWKIGDAADFLEMSDEERQLLDARVSIALAIRQQRQALDLSRKELGARLKTSQPRIAKIERAASDVSLDQLARDTMRTRLHRARERLYLYSRSPRVDTPGLA